MIVKRVWIQHYGHREWAREGWYLFGFIPLLVLDKSPRARINRK